MKTSRPVESGGKPYDVNRRALYAMTEQGKGRQALADFCTIMGMPPPPLDSSWALHSDNIHESAMKFMHGELVEAGIRLRQQLKKEDDSITDSSLLNVTVSFDGTWHHRGFKSSHGVGVAMSVDTGQILDAVVLSKSCPTCEKNRNAKSREDFDAWYVQHKESGNCQQNFDGPSTSMETEAAKIIWQRSIELHKMQYINILSDGDNKTLSALNELMPYGENAAIQKLDCINHVHKRLGTGLRNLLKSCSQIKGGKGGLTKNMIDKLANYYRNAIMSHTTKSKDQVDIGNAVAKMQKSIMASLYHSVYNENPSLQHQHCYEPWCKWFQDQKDGTNTYHHEDQKQKRLPQNFLPHMVPLYTRLSNADLLRRCVPGLTQNQNESYNSTVWKRCPKEKNFGAKAVETAVASATIAWNIGATAQVHLLGGLGLTVFPYCKIGVATKDQKRLYHSRRSAASKEKQKLSKTLNARKESAAKKVFGIDYQPGQL